MRATQDHSGRPETFAGDIAALPDAGSETHPPSNGSADGPKAHPGSGTHQAGPTPRAARRGRHASAGGSRNHRLDRDPVAIRQSCTMKGRLDLARLAVRLLIRSMTPSRFLRMERSGIWGAGKPLAAFRRLDLIWRDTYGSVWEEPERVHRGESSSGSETALGRRARQERRGL